METNFRSSKGDILKGMMRRPETSKILREAFNSPLGSTSRQKAKKILSIMNKLQIAHDGSGGPGIMYQNAPEMMPQEMPQMPQEKPIGIVVFHKIPKPKINFSKKSRDGMGGPGFDGQGGIFDLKPFQNVAYSTPQQTQNKSYPASSENNIFNKNPYSTIASNIAPSQSAPVVETPKNPSKWTNIWKGIGNWLTETNPTYDAYGNIETPGSPGIFGDLSEKGTIAKSNPLIKNEAPVYSTPVQYQSVQPAAQNATQNQTPQINFPETGSSFGNAAKNVASLLGVDPSTPLSSVQISDLAKAIAQNEGFTSGASAIAINHNNPGNLKFVGQPGATQGRPASDGGYYAMFQTVQDGWDALQRDLQIKYNSGKYNTVADLMNVYSPEPGIASKYYGLSAEAQKAVENDSGAGMFTYNQIIDPNNPITHGKTFGQAIAENQTTLWDKYNIGGLQNEINTLKAEGATLPRDIESYITARDKYIATTDKNISDFISNAMSSGSLSDPANAAKVNSQLNYLYTLRGRQNQSYIGYLTDAVNQHQAELDGVLNQYSTALNAYQNELTNANKVTESEYNMYMQALSDMYTAIEGAPLKAQQARLYEEQILQAHATAITDPIKNSAQTGIITQSKNIEGYWGWDGTKTITETPDLVKTINDLASLDPSIQPVNIIQTFANDVLKYASQPDDPTPGNGTGTGITLDTKKKVLEGAITHFSHLAQSGSDNANTVLLGQQYANDMAKRLASIIGSQVESRSDSLIEAVKTLAPQGWFAAKASPTLDKFIETVKTKTNNGIDESIAAAIYAVFQRYVADGGTPAGAVNAMLYNTSSTSTKTIPFTAQEFAYNIGSIYASNIVDRAFTSI